MTVQSQYNSEEIQIARYRDLEREVTDPFAICLLRMIIEELEADLRNACHRAPQASPLSYMSTFRLSPRSGREPVAAAAAILT